MTWSFYAVKTLYRWEAHGRPRIKSREYDAKVTLFEERIVLVRARSGNEAVRKGVTEARKYARSHHMNPYGEQVQCRWLEVCEAQELFHPPGPNIEVYSSTHLLSKDVSDRELIANKMGTEADTDWPKRRRFFNSVAEAALIEARRRMMNQVSEKKSKQRSQSGS